VISVDDLRKIKLAVALDFRFSVFFRAASSARNSAALLGYFQAV